MLNSKAKSKIVTGHISSRCAVGYHDMILSKKMNVALKIAIAKKFKNTPLGFLRIKKNLDISHFSDIETEAYLKQIILSTPLEDIETKGKNHYFKCLKNNAILTVNSHTFTIITAKQIGKETCENLIQSG